MATGANVCAVSGGKVSTFSRVRDTLIFSAAERMRARYIRTRNDDEHDNNGAVYILTSCGRVDRVCERCVMLDSLR